MNMLLTLDAAQQTNQILTTCRGGQPFSTSCSKAVPPSALVGNPARWLGEVSEEKKQFHHSSCYEWQAFSGPTFPWGLGKLRLMPKAGKGWLCRECSEVAVTKQWNVPTWGIRLSLLQWKDLFNPLTWTLAWSLWLILRKKSQQVGKQTTKGCSYRRVVRH